MGVEQENARDDECLVPGKSYAKGAHGALWHAGVKNVDGHCLPIRVGGLISVSRGANVHGHGLHSELT